VFRRKNKREILAHTRQNSAEVLASETCGCLGCGSVFPPAEIKDWTDEPARDRARADKDRTAICPHCGEAMVIGDRSGHKVSPAFLDAMRAHMR
jgi:hypothetical protein